jgi:hypothetical protein
MAITRIEGTALEGGGNGTTHEAVDGIVATPPCMIDIDCDRLQDATTAVRVPAASEDPDVELGVALETSGATGGTEFLDGIDDVVIEISGSSATHINAMDTELESDGARAGMQDVVQ